MIAIGCPSERYSISNGIHESWRPILQLNQIRVITQCKVGLDVRTNRKLVHFFSPSKFETNIVQALHTNALGISHWKPRRSAHANLRHGRKQSNFHHLAHLSSHSELSWAPWYFMCSSVFTYSKGALFYCFRRLPLHSSSVAGFVTLFYSLLLSDQRPVQRNPLRLCPLGLPNFYLRPRSLIIYIKEAQCI